MDCDVDFLELQIGSEKIQVNRSNMVSESVTASIESYLAEPATKERFLYRLKGIIARFGIENISYCRYGGENVISTSPQKRQKAYLEQQLFPYDWTHKYCRVCTLPKYYSEIRKIYESAYAPVLEKNIDFIPDRRDEVLANEEILNIMWSQGINEYLLIPGRSVSGGQFLISLSTAKLSREKFIENTFNHVAFLQNLSIIVDRVACRHLGMLNESFNKLTPAVLDVLRLYSSGYSIADIARQRDVKKGTVRNQLEAAREAFDVKSSDAAVFQATQLNMI